MSAFFIWYYFTPSLEFTRVERAALQVDNVYEVGLTFGADANTPFEIPVLGNPRLGIRYRREGGPAQVATLNGTLCAMGRTIVALLEVHQQRDGSVRVPKALQSHLGREVLEPTR